MPTARCNARARSTRRPRRDCCMGCRSRSRICSTRSTCRPRYGSPIYADHRPAADAASVALARAAGAIVVGKTVTTEFATFHPGPTCNPHNPKHTPGGSSSGSAAAVADWMVPLAFGTQTAGSIVRPAAFCGVVGYKPTYGTINRVGVKMISDTLDTVGALARSVPDVALFVAALSDRRELLIERPHGRRAAGRPVQDLRVGPGASGNGRGVRGCGAAPERRPARAFATSCCRRSSRGSSTRSSRSWCTRSRNPCRTNGSSHRDKPERRDDRHDRSRSCGIAGALRRGAGIGSKLPRGARRVFSTTSTSCLRRAPSARRRKGLQATGDPLFNRMWTLLHTPCVHLPSGAGRADCRSASRSRARSAADRCDAAGRGLDPCAARSLRLTSSG